MNTDTLAKKDEAKTVPALTVEQRKAFELLRLDAELGLKRMESKELRARFIGLLPVATEEQFSVVEAAARDELELPEGCRVNQDFRLDETQMQILKDVRATRVQQLTANKAALVKPLLVDEEQRLVSLKVRIGPKKTTTTARFERFHGAAPGSKGLMAQLRATVKDL